MCVGHVTLDCNRTAV